MALNKDFKVKNGLTVTESLSVGGDSRVNALTATTFEALTAKFNKTIVSTTSALSVVNNGTGPALLVQQDGAQPIAHFIDKDGDDIIFHDDGKVSIGSRTAVEQLTVTGNISATGGRAGNYGDHSDFGPGYRLWYDASDENSIIRDSNGKVSAWISQDRIEYGSTQDKINLYQSTTSAMPTYGTRKQNGLNVVDIIF